MAAYVKTVWATGDIITAVKLNNAENGIAAATPLDGSVAMTGKLNTPGLTILDKRNTTTLPANYSKDWSAAFKTLIDMGLNGIATGTYCTVLGIKGWNDDSGGKAWEIAYTDSGVYQRSGTIAGGWGAWARLAEISIAGDLLIGPALNQKVATEAFAIAMAVALGG